MIGNIEQVVKHMEVTDEQPQTNTEETPRVMYISLNQAAKLWGKSKGTISKLASSGKLQWHPQPNGERKLFLPELSQRFGSPPSEQQKRVSEQSEVTSRQPHANSENAIENSRLEAELKAAREMLEQLRDRMKRETELLEGQLTRERQNADQWRRQAEQATDILKALPAPANHNEETTAEHKRNFWQRVFGGRA